MVAGLEFRFATINNSHEFDDAAIHDFAIRRLDESKRVDARIAGERRNQTNVRAFRRLDRADAAIVCRVHVTHFETGAFAAQTARSKRRQTPFVRNFRKRICLIHEL